jgi:malate dehydrogenase (oxaloacetate-decarboxylating)(NADP+)
MNDTTPKGGKRVERRSRPSFTDQEALQFHAQGRPGKIEVVPTKPRSLARLFAGCRRAGARHRG